MLSLEKESLRAPGALQGGQSQGKQQGGQRSSICNIQFPHQILPPTSAKKLWRQAAATIQEPQSTGSANCRQPQPASPLPGITTGRHLPRLQGGEADEPGGAGVTPAASSSA